MIEWNVLEAPVNFPHTCISCGNGRGPVAATHRQIRGYGDIYICEGCALNVARLFGFAPGKRLEELSKASKRVGELETELTRARTFITSLEERIAGDTRTIDSLGDDLVQARGRIVQLTERIREEAESSLELVGDAA